MLFRRITTMFSDFQTLANHEKFIFMLCYPDRELLTIVGKFIYNCFKYETRLSSLTLMYYLWICIYVYICIHVSVSSICIYIYVHVWVHMHWGLVVHICVGDFCHRWFGLRAFRINGVKSLAKPTLTFCQLDMCKQPSLKILHWSNVYWSLSSLIIHSFIHLLVSFAILHWPNVYLLVSSLIIY